MDLSGVVVKLSGIGPRRACSDAERRAARALARELKALGRPARTETLWVRPQWPGVWLVHALLGIVASVVSTSSGAGGLAIAVVAALSALLELSGRLPGLSVLWPRRATQNVVSTGPGRARVRLLVTAGYDAPRTRGPFSWPMPLGVLALALVALAGCAGARLGGVDATWLGAVQLVPTIVCIAATASLVDLVGRPATTAPNPADSGPAAALALVEALDRRPPRRLEVDVVFAGAGAAQGLGFRRYVAAHRRSVRAEAIAVVHLEPCGAGEPQVWRRDGPLWPLRLHPDLVAAAEHAGFAPHDGHGTTGALAARRARWPAVAVGRRGARGAVPDALEDGAIEDTVARCLELVRRLDAQLAGRPA